MKNEFKTLGASKFVITSLGTAKIDFKVKIPPSWGSDNFFQDGLVVRRPQRVDDRWFRRKRTGTYGAKR